MPIVVPRYVDRAPHLPDSRLTSTRSPAPRKEVAVRMCDQCQSGSSSTKVEF